MAKYPCEKCERRSPGCHERCAEYKEAAKKNEAVKKARHKYLERDRYIAADIVRKRGGV